jgi:hypothetical protein
VAGIGILSLNNISGQQPYTFYIASVPFCNSVWFEIILFPLSLIEEICMAVMKIISQFEKKLLVQ